MHRELVLNLGLDVRMTSEQQHCALYVEYRVYRVPRAWKMELVQLYAYDNTKLSTKCASIRIDIFVMHTNIPTHMHT